MGTRRGILKVIGGGVILAAGAAAAGGGYVMTRSIAPAQAPWAEAGRAPDRRRRVLSYAILAPSPHNRQPWLVDLPGTTDILLYADPERRLPMTDPYDRQITIGLGCFLELLALAAAEEGYGAEITLFPEGAAQEQLDDRPVASVRLVADAAMPDPLFAQVLDRRSSKEPYDVNRPLAQTDLEAIAASAEGPGVEVRASSDTEFLQRSREITVAGYQVEGRTPHLHQESVDLMRIGAVEINAHPDGIELFGPMIEIGRLAGAVTRARLADVESPAYAQGEAMLRKACETAMAQIWIVTSGNDRADQIAAGRAHVRANLKAAELGIGMHPNSQVMQEDPVFATLQAELHTLVGAADGEKVQMLSRLGYGPDVVATPRWPAESRIMAG